MINLKCKMQNTKLQCKIKKIIFLFAILIFEFYTLNLYAMNKKEAVKAANIGQSTQEDPYSWDFGRVDKNTVLTHGFVLKNESKTVMHIDSVTTSCGCTASEAKQKSLKPGESTVISVKLDTKGYSGIIKQFVYVNTDSTDNAVVKFTVQAEVK